MLLYTDYLGIPMYFNCVGERCYCRIGANKCDGSYRFTYIYEPSVLHNFPNLTQEDLFKCICAIKRKYNIL